MSIDIRETAYGEFEITFRTRFRFGDRVAFDSVNGQGEGRISDIVLAADGSHYFYILLDDGTLQPGVYPGEITLLERP